VEILRALKDFRVKGVVISESPNIEEDAILMKKKYESI
jgi:deoxyribonuclease-4